MEQTQYSHDDLVMRIRLKHYSAQKLGYTSMHIFMEDVFSTYHIDIYNIKNMAAYIILNTLPLEGD